MKTPLLLTFLLIATSGFAQNCLSDSLFIHKNFVDDKEVGSDFQTNLVDMDNDGDLDIVTAVFNIPGLSGIMLYSNEAGTFGEGIPIFLQSFLLVQSIDIADLNGDGLPDIVSTEGVPNTLQWRAQLGDGTFADPIILDNDIDYGLIESGDIDLDGDFDLTINCRGGFGGSLTDAIYLYENVSGDGSEFTRTLAASLPSPMMHRLADINSDGYLDIATCSRAEDYVRYIPNNQNGGFDAAVSIDENFDGRCLDVVDIDGDNLPDIAAATLTLDDPRLVWYRNLGNDAFSAAQLIATSESTVEIAHLDIDEDGDMDIANVSFDGVVWHENQNNGSTWFSRVVENISTQNNSLNFGDINGDGRVDLLSASTFPQSELFWYENTCITDTDNIAENEVLNVQMFPNPVRDELYIQLGSVNSDARIEILNAQGQLIYTNKLNEANERIDMSDLASGMYLIQIAQGGQSNAYRVEKL